MFQSILDRELHARIKTPDADEVSRLFSQHSVNSRYSVVSGHYENPSFRQIGG